MDRWPDSQDYTIGWVCALPLELTAAVAILDEQHPPLPQDELDDNVYEFGRVGQSNIIIACLPSGVYGVTSAATVIAHMRRSFPSIKSCLMVGIAGGAPMLPQRDIRLGDVVVSEPVKGFGGVLQYDFGKTVQEGRFVQTGVLNKPPKIFLTALAKLKSENLLQQQSGTDDIPPIPQEFSRPQKNSDQLFQTHYDHPPENSSCDQCDSDMVVEGPPRARAHDQPYVHYGLIASGNQVMKHGKTRDLLAQEKEVLCFEMEAAGLMDEMPTMIIRGICDYSDSHKNKLWQPYAAFAAAAFAKKLLSKLPPRANDEGEQIKRSRLNLPFAEGAVFGSYADQHESECLPGTRVDLLNQITEWADDPEGKSMFWLVGRAGTGKSTISRTVARFLQGKGWLGASFFFKRGEADRSRSALLFTTIAHQLAAHSRYLAFYIQRALQEDPDISRKALKEQFDKLVLQPLLEIKPASRRARLVLLIDALDECDQKEDVKVIIHLLGHLKNTRNADVRVFLTSRPDLPIRPAFKRLPDGTYKSLVLHEVPSIRDDILLFMKDEMSKIQEEHELAGDWPDDEDVQKLVEMAVPLFIYAATLCRFIGDEDWDPNERIKMVLEYRTGWQASQLHKTYLPILDQLSVRQNAVEHERFIKEFRQIVGAIVNLASPLSISSLACLLSVSETIVENRLKPLHSVLNVPSSRFTPVKVFHASFRDFLLDQTLQGKSQFWIDEKDSHRMIASSCIELMSGPSGLKRNICNLESPATLQYQFDRSLIDVYISSELRYACHYWVYHLIKGGHLVVENDHAHKFLQEHLLHWLEAMSHLKLLVEALNAVNALTSIIDNADGETVRTLVYDIKRFILRNRYIINEAPLQLYYSALAFLPTKSLLRKIFDPEKTIVEVCDLPKVQEEWDPCLLILEPSDGVVNWPYNQAMGHKYWSAATDNGAAWRLYFECEILS
ncbi:hypothetical protein TWF696_006410 [Orbilia brochopaga]|uniref:NACHT domain-containing protein n=1 Tax=Orbilia brochopaga TaxID=3140254 RepID=A0AAV9UZI8_9PEZI